MSSVIQFVFQFRSSLRIELMASSYLLRPVLTRSVGTVSSRWIWRRPKLLMGNSPNHIKFIKLCSWKGLTFFNVVVTHVVSRRHTENPRFSTRPQWNLTAITQEFNLGLAALSLAEKEKGCVSFDSLQIHPTSEEFAMLVSLRHGPKVCDFGQKNKAKNEAGCYQNRVASHFNRLASTSSCTLVNLKIAWSHCNYCCYH